MTFFLRPVLIPETDAAAREADFAVLLTNGSMEPLYSAGTILLCKREHASRQEYGLFLLNQEAFIRRLYYKRGITKLVAPNLNFKDIIIHENDSLKCIGTITGIAHGCRWE